MATQLLNCLKYSEKNDSAPAIQKEYIHKRDPNIDIIEKARIYGVQILKAIGYFQKKRIVHRDIKPANFVFNKNQTVVKLIDLGLSTEYSLGLNVEN